MKLITIKDAVKLTGVPWYLLRAAVETRELKTVYRLRKIILLNKDEVLGWAKHYGKVVENE